MQSKDIALGRFKTEIIELHQFFQDWFLGTVEKNEKKFSRFANSMDEKMHIISPNGVMQNKVELCESLWNSHGVFRNKSEFRIEVRNVGEPQIFGDTWLVVYEEWHIDELAGVGRLSSALFRLEDDDLQWCHVHETNLPKGDSV